MYTELKYIKKFGSEEIESIKCKIQNVVSNVPIDPANLDYAEIMKQVDAGELTIEPADEE